MENTFIIPAVRPDLIERCLETLYRHTPPNFYVIVVDQTLDGLDSNMRNRYKNLTYIRTPKTDIHTTGNLGFAKANNFAFDMVKTPYFTMCNDDIEFINRRWWYGVMQTFKLVESQTPDRPAVMVNPSSTKLPDWSVGRDAGDHHYVIPYKSRYNEDEYTHLLEDDHYVNEHLTLKPNSVIDGVTMYCSVFNTERFKEVGPLNEKFYPGGGEDYDWNCRANMVGYRSVGTTNAWVYHHWSSTISGENQEKLKLLMQDELRWNNVEELWGKDFDVWGMKDMKPEDIPPIELHQL